MALGAGRLRLFHQLADRESSCSSLMAGVAAIFVARLGGRSASCGWRRRPATGSRPSTAPGRLARARRSPPVWPSWRSCCSACCRPGARRGSTSTPRSKPAARGAVGGRRQPGARAGRRCRWRCRSCWSSASGLLVQSFQNLLDVDLGFESRAARLGCDRHARSPRRHPQRACGAAPARAGCVRVVPGVRSASLAICGIQSGCRAREDGFEIEGYQRVPAKKSSSLVNAVSSVLLLDRRHADARGTRVHRSRCQRDVDAVAW